VLLYVAAIYLTSYLVPLAVGALGRAGLGWVVRYGPVVGVFLALVFAGYRLLQSPSRRSMPMLGLLGAVAVGYGYFIRLLSGVPVERVHLLEYGLLAVLLVRVLEGRHGPVRTLWYAVSLVFLIGFIDEILQGVLPNRYYDARDVATNVCSGLFGLGLLYIFRNSSGPGPNGRQRQALLSARAHRPHDLGLALAVLCSLVALAAIEHYPVGESLIYGVWQRPCRCGGMERFRFAPPDSFRWEDTQGNFVRGRYRLGGNHLEGAKITFAMEEQHNSSTCGLSSSGGRNKASSYLRVSADRFYFDRHKDRPWAKIAQD